MKVKTSVSLSLETVKNIDRIAGKSASRSAVIEEAVRAFVAVRERQARYQRELALLNAHADKLNSEVEDALSYQVG